MKYGLILMSCAFLIASCGSWPQLDTPSASRDATWPVLLPLDQITVGSTAQSEAQRLSARAANLRARARIMRQTVADQEAFEALRARLAR